MGRPPASPLPPREGCEPYLPSLASCSSCLSQATWEEGCSCAECGAYVCPDCLDGPYCPRCAFCKGLPTRLRWVQGDSTCWLERRGFYRIQLRGFGPRFESYALFADAAGDWNKPIGEHLRTRHSLAEAKAECQAHMNAIQGVSGEAVAAVAPALLTAREIAKMLGVSRPAIASRASAERWPYEPFRGNGGITHAYRVYDLPLKIQLRIFEACRDTAGGATAGEARIAGPEKAKPARCRTERASEQYNPDQGSAPCH